jgi:hypothetical protein
MTYENLKTLLEYHASEIGIQTFRFGFVEEINTLREKDKASLYPIMLVIPPNLKTSYRGNAVTTELTFFIINTQTKEERLEATREEAWDYMIGLGEDFLNSVSGDDNFSVLTEALITGYPAGITVNDDLGVEFVFTLKMPC